MTQSNLTQVISEFVVNSSFEDLDEKLINVAKDCLVDWLGCALAGSTEEAIGLIKDTYSLVSNGDDVTLIGFGDKASLTNGVIVNGASGNILDLDDVFPGMIGHPSSALWPGILAVGEWKGLSGKEILSSFIVGYEVMARIGLSIQPEHYEKGWHATGTLGHFGATASIANLLGINVEQLNYAFSIAATQAGGLRGLFGTPSKTIHHGRASFSGITAVLLAHKGLISNENIFEDMYGFPEVFGSTMNSQAISEGLGETFQIEKTAFKRHAACGSIHSTIDAILEIMETHHVLPEEISRIELTVHQLADDLSNDPNPKTGLEGKYSLQFSSAVAVLEKAAMLEHFTDEMVQRQDVQDLMKKVVVQVDPNYQYIEAMPAKVKIYTNSNEELSCYSDKPVGRPSSPMSEDQKLEKFVRLGSRRSNEDRLISIYHQVKKLETVKDMSNLISLLA